MPNTENTTIFKKIYDLILLIYQYVQLFPRQDKFILGERIKNAAIDLLESTIKANQLENKVLSLYDVSTKLDILRVYMRLAKDLRLLDLKKYETASIHIVEIGKMLGGWIKYEKKPA
jgi:hypothetical protein